MDVMLLNKLLAESPLFFSYSSFYANFRLDKFKLGLGLPRRVRKEVYLGPRRS